MTSRPTTPDSLQLIGLPWPDVEPGSDLAALVLAYGGLRDRDIVVLTSKVVSKAEGRLGSGSRHDAVQAEAVRVVAQSGDTSIVQTRHGLVVAAAGVDASNTPTGTHLLLPVDPDATARIVRERVWDRAGLNIAVIISDTAGRAWRVGQTDHAIGCAGVDPAQDLTGSWDSYGNELRVTSPAIADELAAAGDLVKGKATGRPVAVVRGAPDWVLPVGHHGAGAGALVRAAGHDLFGLGSREAVLAAALERSAVTAAHFGRPGKGAVTAAVSALESSLHTDQARVDWTVGDQSVRLVVSVPETAPGEVWVEAGAFIERADAVLHAFRYVRSAAGTARADSADGWHVVSERTWIAT